MAPARALRWLVSGAEIIGRRISNALNPHVQLEETLNVLMRPTDDGRVHIGLVPLSFSIVMRSGRERAPHEIYPEHILTHGAPTEEVASAYRQATWRVEIARVVPGKRRVGVSDDVRPAKSLIPSTKPQCRTY